MAKSSDEMLKSMLRNLPEGTGRDHTALQAFGADVELLGWLRDAYDGAG
jgi:hypothetical protein